MEVLRLSSTRFVCAVILNTMLRWAMLLGILSGIGFSQDIRRDLPYVSIDIRTPPVAPRTAGGYLLPYEMFVTNWYDKKKKNRADYGLARRFVRANPAGE